ncbi:class I SAM-dependent methyltransferase [Cylindrospermopsis raciborskii Cr2010]|uniref:class I SAM-dependent methyltransferase n=1 Tax=Cylindrospermopsis raciborskii TaxID=77022 RepID=UPI000E1E8DCA|nr:class I SAM-dependent methyltransferase [Cylindrospermopsis raciborskii]UJL33545.1 class I SAM-dependent methyltransferase [Cylindrospermopsis raciborskii Cr2010]
MQSLKFCLGKTENPIFCPICGFPNDETFLEVKTFDAVVNKNYIDNRGIKCSNCHSLLWEKSKLIGYLTDDEDANEFFTNHYVLVGCGIDYGINLLSRLKDKNGSLLEVGCGFGFNVDYWSRRNYGSALGLEAAKYGDIGRQLLGANIINKYLDVSDNPIGCFDIVISSEVIEHVDDPKNFLVAIRKNMKDNGILILTTPSAEFIQENEPLSLMLAALSPGFHNFILSIPAIKDILESAGFKNNIIEKHNERLVVYASPKADINSLVRKTSDPSEYMNYLDYLSDSGKGVVKEGAQWRLFKEYVNLAMDEKAEIEREKIEKTISEKYNITISELITRNIEEISLGSTSKYLYNIPPYLGIYLYYFGILLSRKSSDIMNKVIIFGMSYRMLAAIYKSGPSFSQETESLIKTAGIHFYNSLIDNSKYLSPYSCGHSSGLADEFQEKKKPGTGVLSYFLKLLKKIRSMI